MKYDLNPLPYAYDALEPFIDTTTMQIHHDKHHAAYINNLNAALESQVEFADRPLEDLLTGIESLPESIRTAVRNQGGGTWNHDHFWKIMSPGAGGIPKGKLFLAIEGSFGGFDKFQSEFEKAALGQFGSGWAWLVKKGGDLVITTTPNQNNPLSVGLKPLMGLDIWEHAYYLKYQNRRGDYIKNWWNIVNWDEIGRLYLG